MSGIAGFLANVDEVVSRKGHYVGLLETMKDVIRHRGPDEEGWYLNGGCGLCQVRLVTNALQDGRQPMTKKKNGREVSLVMDGGIYNGRELRTELEMEGCSFETDSDAEVLLQGYWIHGTEFFEKLNGVYSFAIYDGLIRRLVLGRDRLGIKPLFYTVFRGNLFFASEMKAILNLPDYRARIKEEGLCEIFALGPAKTPGKGVFDGIYEIGGGEFAALYEHDFGEGKKSDGSKVRTSAYWKMNPQTHRESFEETVAHTRWLIEDAVKMQMKADVPICSFLSGGVDSSLVTSIAAKELAKSGEKLDTFSFDFEGNKEYFRATAFQPSLDRPYVDRMVKECDTNHRYLFCTNEEMLEALYPATLARDLPGMADVESSILHFCKLTVPYAKVALTGECADEIFGGYPWYHREELLNKKGFPWSNDFSMRTAMLQDGWIGKLNLKEYEQAAYDKTVAEAPVNMDLPEAEQKRQRLNWLNLKWFMVTLLDRMDRTSMAVGLEARVPFADHRIAEYLYQIPWEMKCPDGVVKGLLRKAGEGYLPYEVLYRKKSPYPKTYHPEYESMLKKRFREILADSSRPIHKLVDVKKAEAFMNQLSDYGKPWYGQLMAGPQLYAYWMQIDMWLEHYKIEIV